jgi:hypothetical protein
MAKETKCYCLIFPPHRTRHPVIWEMTQNFDLIFNLCSASTTDEVGVIDLELVGETKDIENAVKWFKKKGIEVILLKSL